MAKFRLSDEDLQALEEQLRTNPNAGDVLRGTGGLRKIRFAAPSRHTGKSGAFRGVYGYFHVVSTVYLFIIFAKKDQENLTDAEAAAAKKMMESLFKIHNPKEQPMAKKTKKSREMVDGIMEGVRELQQFIDRGMTHKDIKAHYRKHHPDRIRTVSFPVPGKHSPESVKKLRAALGMSQPVFAGLIGVSAILVQSWERGVREPSPLARRLLDIVSEDPAAWLASLMRKGHSRRAG